jgi:hypothetical protein
MPVKKFNSVLFDFLSSLFAKLKKEKLINATKIAEAIFLIKQTYNLQ